MHTDITVKEYDIHELADYINWIYFFHAWGFQPKYSSIADIHGCDGCRAMWLVSFKEDERPKASEAMQLHKEAQRMLNSLDGRFKVYAMYRLMDANSDGDNLIMEGTRFPLLRQQSRVKDSDEGDDYKLMLCKTLAERLAEAAAEKIHETIRKSVWAYAPDENLSIKELLDEKYCGIRPAVGYPSLPDISVNFLLDDLLDMKRIGITLTENGMMYPHASVSGLMFAHPQSRYFSVGKIDEAQLADYAERRGKTADEMRKYLRANVG